MMLGNIDGNLEGDEITTALYKTLQGAKKKFKILKPYSLKKGKRWDSENQYIKLIFAVSDHLDYTHDADDREEKYQILIGIGSYGNNEYLGKVREIQKVILFLRQLFQHSEDMIVKDKDGNIIVDLREHLKILTCYPTYNDSGDVIKEGIMNLSFNVYENLVKHLDDFEVHQSFDSEFELSNDDEEGED